MGPATAGLVLIRSSLACAAVRSQPPITSSSPGLSILRVMPDIQEPNAVGPSLVLDHIGDARQDQLAPMQRDLLAAIRVVGEPVRALDDSSDHSVGANGELCVAM